MSQDSGGGQQFYICDCFTAANIFLEEYKLHVRFVSPQQFRSDYQDVREWVNSSVIVGGLKKEIPGVQWLPRAVNTLYVVVFSCWGVSAAWRSHSLRMCSTRCVCVCVFTCCCCCKTRIMMCLYIKVEVWGFVNKSLLKMNLGDQENNYNSMLGPWCVPTLWLTFDIFQINSW